jgi:hypothetical protein
VFDKSCPVTDAAKSRQNVPSLTIDKIGIDMFTDEQRWQLFEYLKTL